MIYFIEEFFNISANNWHAQDDMNMFLLQNFVLIVFNRYSNGW